MLQTWFKIFFRNQQKNWLNILINVSGLTLGLAGLLIILLYLNEENSYNQWNPNKNNIYRVNVKHRANGTWHVATAGQYHLYKSDIPEVEETLMIDNDYRSRVVIHENLNEFTKKVVYTEPQFFSFFPFDILKGSTQKFEESRRHLALSEAFAKRLFKEGSAIGKIVKIGKIDYTITTIFKVQGNSHVEPDMIVPFEEPYEVNWGNHNNEVFCKIKENTDLVALKEKMDTILIEKAYTKEAEEGGVSLEVYEERFGFREVVLDQLDTIYLHNTAKRAGPSGTGNYQLLVILLGLSILLIIISCVNFINLSIATATQRSKEIGVKKTLGSSKKQLMLQYVLEIIFQGIISYILSLILVELVLPYFNEFVGKDISILQMSTIGTLFLVMFLVSLLVGIIPAIYIANFKAVEVLKGNVSKTKRGNLARNIMLGIQFLISGFFIISIFVINYQIQFMINKDLGFSKESTLSVDVYNIGDGQFKKYKLAKDVLSKNENIIDISTSMFIPGEGFVNGTDFRYTEKNISFNSASNLVDLNYIDFAKIKVLKGRGFSEKFASDTITGIVINETVAKRMGVYNDPIGKKVRIGWMNDDRADLEVIGMIQDYHFDGFDTEISPMFMVSWQTFEFTRNWLPSIQFKVRTDNIDKTIAEIESFWRANVDTKYPFNYEFLDQKFAKTYEKYKKQQTMFLILSIIVVIIALLGLFALATLTIQQRLKEVAIRKTLGASVKEIMFQLIKNFLKITVVASLFLIPFAYYFMQNWLGNFAYKIDMPLLPYLITPIILVTLVFIVVGLKAYNATKVDLIKYLKFE
ncbi:putative ABC transport system permease protein [Tenacibaculum sp. MAR_2010_89]|uniref:ABC transporter permease n=1 Tax=Tenacibaculum sp. MAR_2010_89 TaxID=1250198 RepID=UPI00089A9F7C|nr:ABC transporter permease [Tenacibaculum sp. MAR_2010_89]SEE52410.1 putative ABC transport system permease protein [Tenacibaculum sp. MAR_2010_89]